MLFRCIQAENKKLRRSAIWFACFLLPVIPAVYGTFNYAQNTGVLTMGWYSLWTQFTLFYALLFYAPLIALYAAYLWRLEHLDHNWNVFMAAPVPVHDLFFGKLVIILKVTLITQLWLYALFVLCGKFLSLPGMPDAQILLWALRGTLAGIAVGSLQLLLSMQIRSFAAPVGIALLGSIVGFLAANGSRLGQYFPYALMIRGMNANAETDVLGQGLAAFLLVSLCYFILFSGLSIFLLKNRDVKA